MMPNLEMRLLPGRASAGRTWSSLAQPAQHISGSQVIRAAAVVQGDDDRRARSKAFAAMSFPRHNLCALLVSLGGLHAAEAHDDPTWARPRMTAAAVLGG
jgi:hypothetical protein